MSHTDEIECVAEQIDGVWTHEMCGCPDCLEEIDDERERHYEATGEYPGEYA